MQQCVRILVVTATPGVDRKAIVRRVEDEGIAGASFHHSDSLNAIERLAEGGHGLCVLEGTLSPSGAREAFKRLRVDGHIVLLDGGDALSRESREQAIEVLDVSSLGIEGAAKELSARVGALAVV